jgi:Ca-activated chloride channel family protein
MIAEFVALAAVILMAAAEALHARRVRHLAALAFGPRRRPAPWTWTVPVLRTLAAGALTWGLTTLLLLTPKVHKIGVVPESEYRDLVLVLDVSPSMRLNDAGPDGKMTRRKRASDLLKSFFDRAPMELYRTTILAVYTETKPVALRTTDPEVVRNILEELPMEFAFKSGPTDLFTGLHEAARVARPWRPRGTTVIVISDGDTVPPTGLPRMPDSVANVLIVGVGDPYKGRFIAGHLSRQDVSALRQLAVRLGGTYHDGNEKHLSTDLVRRVTLAGAQSLTQRLTRREYALMAIGAGSAVLALVPLLLHLAGTSWRPGVRLSLAGGN